MPRLSPVESQRTDHLISYWKKRRTILSPSASGSKLANFFDTSATWDMGDDYRTDRFSENYYRHYWGMHKGGLVLGTFFGLVLIVSAVVGAAFCHIDTVL